MTEQYRNNYFRLVAVIVDVAFLVIRKYIREKILGPDSFQIFLNKEKHKLVHIYETSQCCECMIEKISGQRLISRNQLQILYKSEEKNEIHNHKKYDGHKLTQICICKYSAKENIDVRVVDITLANYIIQKCGQHELGIANWIEQIKDVRNEIFHLSDTQEITAEKFGRKWTKLEGSIMGIAKVIDAEFAEKTEKNISQAKRLVLIGDYMLKYEIICRDYWKNKCAEFERAHIQVIEEKTADLHHTMPNLYCKSMEKDCQKTMRKIETLNTMVDKINILINIFGSEETRVMFDATELLKEDVQRINIPVFLQLDIPILWDKTKVYGALDGLRLNGTPDMNIKIKAISMDDLNMYADIAEKVLCNVNELRSEINKMMSTMLLEADIDTTKNAEFDVNLEVQDISENELYTGEALALDGTSVKTTLPVSLNLRKELIIKPNALRKTSSCIKICNTLVFTDNCEKQIIICNTDGSNMQHITLSDSPWYITEVDSETAAVSCYKSTIMIINISTRSVTNRIDTSTHCQGLSYSDNNLYVVINNNIIHVMDLRGKVIRTIDLPSDNIHDITVDRNRLVCIDYKSIYCCSLDRKLIWMYTKDEIQDLRRVTTDEEGNVYVTNEKTNTVVVIFNNGQCHGELLSNSDGLNGPYAIYFDKKRKYSSWL